MLRRLHACSRIGRQAAAIAIFGGSCLTCSYSEGRIYSSGEILGRGVRLEFWKAKHPNIVILDLDHEIVRLGMTRVRKAECEGENFIHDANAIMRTVVNFALAELPKNDDIVVTTSEGHQCKGSELACLIYGVSMATSPVIQSELQQVLRDVLPSDSVLSCVQIEQGRNGCYKFLASTSPDTIEDHEILVLIPEISDVECVIGFIHYLAQHGVEKDKITVATLVIHREAADKFCQVCKETRLVTASFDAAKGSDGYIVPGIGNFEERYASLVSDTSCDNQDLSCSSQSR
ncbi:hypothetical protein ABG067_001403 [Albugo candida]